MTAPGGNTAAPRPRLGAVLPCGLVALALLAVALLAGCDRGAGSATATAPAPAVPVTVTTVAQRDVPVQVRAIGNVQPLATVSILSMLNGEVMDVGFAEGEEVSAGARLFTIDPRAGPGRAAPGAGHAGPVPGGGEAGRGQPRARHRPAQQRQGRGGAVPEAGRGRLHRAGAVRPDPHHRARPRGHPRGRPRRGGDGARAGPRGRGRGGERAGAASPTRRSARRSPGGRAACSCTRATWSRPTTSATPWS